MSASDGFRARSLSFRYHGASGRAVDGVDFHAPAGILSVVIGPNGSGKSTLARLLLGVEWPQEGTAAFEGRPLPDWDRKALARRVAAVPQFEAVAFPLRVREYVAMGRYPFLGPWAAEGESDHRAIDAALQRCDVAGLADRDLASLSGGERQRVRIARALAQEPAALVLDEPTASLDVRHEMDIFRLLAELASEGRTVVLVTHSLNLSGRFADRILMLDRGRPAALGTPAEVLRRDVIERVYRWPVRIESLSGPGPDAGAPQVVPLREEISPESVPVSVPPTTTSL